jgi:lipopolysaccharide/colanic/teichoic acid biosynthesis glycosyltransferase
MTPSPTPPAPGAARAAEPHDGDGPPPPAWTSRAIDCALAILLLPLAIPLVGLAAAAVKLTSPGPAFYTQTRLGLNGRRFRIVKVRTMRHDCEAESGVRWATRADPRATRIGRLLRATHLDELPQLLNVLRGEMGLIGPRPERPEMVDALRLAEAVPGYADRLRIRPGVTGLAQVLLPADSDLGSVRRKVSYDQYYLAHRGVWLDLRILLATTLKAAGVGPRVLRAVFRLPADQDVVRAIRSRLAGTASRVRSGVAPHAHPPLDGTTTSEDRLLEVAAGAGFAHSGDATASGCATPRAPRPAGMACDRQQPEIWPQTHARSSAR